MIDRRIKIRHLQTFVEISRHKSFKMAAESLHLTQPAISKTIKDLEQILSVTLFQRDRSGVALTREGEVFLQFARASLAALQQGLGGIEQIKSGGKTRLTVGVLPSVAARIMPEVSQRLADYAPDLTLALLDGPHSYLVDQLRLGALDLVVGRLGQADTMEGLTFTQLYIENVAIVVRPGHPLQHIRQLSDITPYNVIYPSEGSAIRSLADNLLIANGVGELPHRVETVSGIYGRVLTKSTDAVWFISEGVVATELAVGELRALPFNMQTTAGPVGIIMRRDDEISPDIRTFSRIAQHVAGKINALPAT